MICLIKSLEGLKRVRGGYSMILRGDKITHKYFGYAKCLTDVDIECSKGKKITLYGVAKSGKTTLLKILAGLDKPLSGSVFIDNNNISAIKKRDRNIALTLAENALFKYRSVYYNLRYPLKIRGYDKKEIAANLNDIADKFNINGVMYHSARMLEQPILSKVILARALIRNADFYLLDNPFKLLTHSARVMCFNSYYKYIEQLEGGVIYASDSIEEIAYINSYTYILNNGVIVGKGLFSDIVNNPPSIECARVLADRFYNILKDVEFKSLIDNGFINSLDNKTQDNIIKITSNLSNNTGNHSITSSISDNNDKHSDNLTEQSDNKIDRQSDNITDKQLSNMTKAFNSSNHSITSSISDNNDKHSDNLTEQSDNSVVIPYKSISVIKSGIRVRVLRCVSISSGFLLIVQTSDNIEIKLTTYEYHNKDSEINIGLNNDNLFLL